MGGYWLWDGRGTVRITWSHQPAEGGGYWLWGGRGTVRMTRSRQPAEGGGYWLWGGRGTVRLHDLETTVEQEYHAFNTMSSTCTTDTVSTVLNTRTTLRAPPNIIEPHPLLRAILYGDV